MLKVSRSLNRKELKHNIKSILRNTKRNAAHVSQGRFLAAWRACASIRPSLSPSSGCLNYLLHGTLWFASATASWHPSSAEERHGNGRFRTHESSRRPKPEMSASGSVSLRGGERSSRCISPWRGDLVHRRDYVHEDNTWCPPRPLSLHSDVIEQIAISSVHLSPYQRTSSRAWLPTRVFPLSCW